MHFLCIISCAFLIATVNAKSSTTNPTDDDDPYGYYDDPIVDSVPADQSDDASLPPKFLIGPEVVVAKEGESAILKCPTENAEYYGSMWLKEKETITQGTLPLNKDLYAVFKNNSLLIKYIKPASIGYYTCVIAISAKENITLTHRLKLENAAEIVSLRAENNVTQLYTGDTLILTCEVDGKPMPTIKWYFDRNGEDGANELHTGDHQSTGYRDTLIIKDVNNKHNGTYRCFADNKITADHQSIVIEVYVAPTVRIEKIYSSGKTVTGLNCIAESNPLPNIFWKKDGEIINNNSTLRRTKYSLKIIFEHVDGTDFGKYTCVAKNLVDSAEKSVIFIKPLQPQFRRFEPLGNKRDILSWTVISQEPIKSCVVYYKGENETRQAIAATEIVRYKDGYLITHSPLIPTDGTYKFRVKCLGEGGWSDESQERSLGIKGKGRDSATSDSQTSAGLRLVPTIMLFIATAFLMNP